MSLRGPTPHAQGPQILGKDLYRSTLDHLHGCGEQLPCVLVDGLMEPSLRVQGADSMTCMSIWQQVPHEALSQSKEKAEAGKKAHSVAGEPGST
ncbi:hypothetical protein GCM10010246_81520 [Streptomyces cuspidosporus]|uniref:Uncharacterized protein n=1 Tax=Streptomyces cuspidosporus TaxID=66882 RepID=A0ABN3HAP9_9ACTN